MCLSRVKETYDNPSTMVMSGWKQSFTGAKPNLQLAYGTVVEYDKWMQATDKNAPGGGIKADDGKNYLPGFHVYTDDTQFGKDKSSLRRVYVRLVTCLGEQDTRTCVIAQEMYVPTDPNGWPPLASEPPQTPPPPLAPAAPEAPAKKSVMDRLKGRKG